MMIWYRAPIYTAIDMEAHVEAASALAEDSAQDVQFWLDYLDPPVKEMTPGRLSGGVIVTFQEGILHSDWYNTVTDTCLVRLHEGVSTPSGWTQLTREEFIQDATAAGKPSVELAESVWPVEG